MKRVSEEYFCDVCKEPYDGLNYVFEDQTGYGYMGSHRIGVRIIISGFGEDGPKHICKPCALKSMKKILETEKIV